jgi:type IV pilus assembly protein PilC
MTIFEYTAKDQQGNKVKGKIEAQTKSQAAKVLRDKKLIIISLKKPSAVIGGDLLDSLNKVSSADIVTFTRQFSTMIASGLPLTDALNILQAQSKPQFSKIISEVLRDVQGGSTLGSSMEKHIDTFPPVYIALIRAGEAAGVLDDIMKRLADNLEKQQDFRAKTKGALIYPAIVTIGMIIVSIVMMVFVVPKLTVMYEDFGAELPVATQLLINLSDFMANFWYLFLVSLGAGFYFLRAWQKTKKGKYEYDKFLIKLPIMGNLRVKTILSELTRTLSLLVASGITILEALNIVANSIDNEVFKKAIQDSAKQVEKGMPLAETMAQTNVFPQILPQMISVGEETGKLDEVLLKVSKYFESEAENLIRNLTTALEPLIMIVLGVGVGFLIIAIVMPIYNLTSQF